MSFIRGGAARSGKREFYTVVALALSLLAFLLFAAPAWAQNFEVSKEADPDPARVDQELRYTVTITNTGGQISDLELEDTLPRNVRFVDFGRISNGGTCLEPDANRLIVCNFTEVLPRDEEAVVEIIVEPTREGTITNRAEATGTRGSSAVGTELVELDTRVLGRNDGKGKDGRKGKDRGPRVIIIDDGQYGEEDGEGEDVDGDGDVDQDDEIADAESDLNGENTDGQYDDNLGEEDGGVSASSNEDGAEASPPGASASAGGDPDEQEPVSEPQGDVEDEIPTSGPLPNTGGVPVAAGTVLALVLFGAGLLAVRLVMLWRERRA